MSFRDLKSRNFKVLELPRPASQKGHRPYAYCRTMFSFGEARVVKICDFGSLRDRKLKNPKVFHPWKRSQRAICLTPIAGQCFRLGKPEWWTLVISEVFGTWKLRNPKVFCLSRPAQRAIGHTPIAGQAFALGCQNTHFRPESDVAPLLVKSNNSKSHKKHKNQKTYFYVF